MSWPIRKPRRHAANRYDDPLPVSSYDRARLAGGDSPGAVFADRVLRRAKKYKAINQAMRDERSAHADAFDALDRPAAPPPLPTNRPTTTACADCGFHVNKCRCA